MSCYKKYKTNVSYASFSTAKFPLEEIQENLESPIVLVYYHHKVTFAELNDHWQQEKSWDHIQEMRIFSQKGEYYIWRENDNKWKMRICIDEEDPY